MRGSLVRYCGIAAACLTLSGCIHLHSETRQKQGEEATKAWADVELKSTFQVERENLNKLLAVELETQDHLARVVREAELRKMLAAKSEISLPGAITQRLESLAGPLADGDRRLRSWSAANTLYRSNLRQQAEARGRLAFMGAPDLTCEQATREVALPDAWDKWAVARPERHELGLVLLGNLSALCKAAPDRKKTLENTLAKLGGRIGDARDERDSVVKEIDDARASRKRYLQAVAEYERSLKAASPAAGEKATAVVKEAAEALLAAVKALAAAQDAFSKEVVAKERINKLEKTLIDIAANTTGKVPEGATDVVVGAVLLPQIVDDAKAIAAAGNVPATLPLLIRLNIERLRLEAATREVKSLEAQLELSEAIVEALATQAHQLEVALGDLQVAEVKAVAGRPVVIAFAEAEKVRADRAGDPNAKEPSAQDHAAAVAAVKEPLYRAAAQYLDAVGRLDARYHRLEYMRIAAIHEQMLARSEVHAAQWESLIDVTVRQAAQHAAGGLKPSDINGLISALGLLWIGHGTNR